jgi:hypothetical protein
LWAFQAAAPPVAATASARIACGERGPALGAGAAAVAGAGAAGVTAAAEAVGGGADDAQASPAAPHAAIQNDPFASLARFMSPAIL